MMFVLISSEYQHALTESQQVHFPVYNQLYPTSQNSITFPGLPLCLNSTLSSIYNISIISFTEFWLSVQG